MGGLPLIGQVLAVVAAVLFGPMLVFFVGRALDDRTDVGVAERSDNQRWN